MCHRACRWPGAGELAPEASPCHSLWLAALAQRCWSAPGAPGATGCKAYRRAATGFDGRGPVEANALALAMSPLPSAARQARQAPLTSIRCSQGRRLPSPLSFEFGRISVFVASSHIWPWDKMKCNGQFLSGGDPGEMARHLDSSSCIALRCCVGYITVFAVLS